VMPCSLVEIYQHFER